MTADGGLLRMEPFGLKYVGIGNEDAITPIFKERFKMIHDAVKEKHPGIVVIGAGEDFENGWMFARERKLPMEDEPYYAFGPFSIGGALSVRVARPFGDLAESSH